MIKNNENHNNKKKENNKINDSPLTNNNNLSSGEKRIIKIQSDCPKMILESLNNIKSKNIPKRKSKTKYNGFQNYSFSNITSGNDLSKKYFETLEKNTIDIEEEVIKKKLIKYVPIYINHSDYYYCPNSMKEKNLNIQIMKYLCENNLIKDPKYNIFKNKKIKKIKKNKSFNVEKSSISLNNDKNPIINIKYKNSEIIKNDKENIINDKIIDIEKSDINIQNILKGNEKYKINNIEIKYINNLFKNTNNIYSIETRNNIDKPKEIFYSFRTGKTIDASNNRNHTSDSTNNNFFDDSSSCKKRVCSKKIKNKKKSGKNFIPFDTKNLHKKFKVNNICDKKEKNENENKKNNYIEDKNKIKINYEISSKVVNEEFIDKKENKNNDSSDLMGISLQSINDSKMLQLAENYIPKDEEFEQLKASQLINKKKDNNK